MHSKILSDYLYTKTELDLDLDEIVDRFFDDKGDILEMILICKNDPSQSEKIMRILGDQLDEVTGDVIWETNHANY
jgi:hypothetical protein